jgi:hypothetical protein
MSSMPWMSTCLATASAALTNHTLTGSLRHEAEQKTNQSAACTNLLPL